MDTQFERIRVSSLRDGLTLPLCVEPVRSGDSLQDCIKDIQALVTQSLLEHGGLLFRGFQVGGVEQFKAFTQCFESPLLSYEYGSTPRSQVNSGVYSSTEYPAHQHIPLHAEQAYTTDWPMKIWFYSVQCAETGGETPIADNRAIYRQIDASVRTRFEQKKLMYVRNFGNGLDVDWQDVFNTDNPAEVEAFCRRQGIECEWKPDGELRTRQICQATARHPITGDDVWFNQAHLFHVSNLDAEIRETLLSIVDEEDLPRNVYYGDGSAIELSALQHIRDVLQQQAIIFPWQPDDVMMLDNMLSAHARQPFTGSRKVVVAMAEAHQGERFSRDTGVDTSTAVPC